MLMAFWLTVRTIQYEFVSDMTILLLALLGTGVGIVLALLMLKKKTKEDGSEQTVASEKVRSNRCKKSTRVTPMFAGYVLCASVDFGGIGLHLCEKCVKI